MKGLGEFANIDVEIIMMTADLLPPDSPRKGDGALGE